MPELPEVETIRRQLDPELEGIEVVELEILDSSWCAPGPPASVAAEVEGRRIEAFDRRGKYLLMRLEGELTLVMHLRMTGNLLLAEPGEEGAPGEELLRGDPRLARTADEERHLRARFRLGDGRELWFVDPRRFGRGFVADPEGLAAYFEARLGVEPLSAEFTPEHLAEVSHGRTAPLKSFLLDQSRLAGVGNIYADEALFRARLHPLSPADSMRPEHHRALRDAVVAALEAGLEAGGASIDDYRDSRGEKGAMQDEFLVHRREGLPCPECGEPVRRIVVSGRSTYFCADCQVRLRRRIRRGRG